MIVFGRINSRFWNMGIYLNHVRINFVVKYYFKLNSDQNTKYCLGCMDHQNSMK